MNAHLEAKSGLDAMCKEMVKRIDAAKDLLSGYIDHTNGRIGSILGRLDRIYQAMVRLEEKQDRALRLNRVEKEMAELKRRLAARSRPE
jgi:hypothetical protein